MVKKENQRILLTKRLLQDGLLQLLETKELDRISVTELCRVSGINRATFYNHYASPQDLLSDMEGQLTSDLDKLMDYPTNYDESLAQLEAICAYMYEHKRPIVILSRCNVDSDLVETFHRLNDFFPRRSPKSRLTANMDQASLSMTATFVYTGCYHLILEWLVMGYEKTPREIAELILNILTKEIQHI